MTAFSIENEDGDIVAQFNLGLFALEFLENHHEREYTVVVSRNIAEHAIFPNTSEGRSALERYLFD